MLAKILPHRAKRRILASIIINHNPVSAAKVRYEDYSIRSFSTMSLKVKLCSVLVDDQDKALEFYTNVLGFLKKTEIDMGEAKWLTVVSPDSDYVEVVLEPKFALEEAKTYTKALKEKGIPLTAFEVDDIHKVYKELKEKGVHFKSEPKDVGDGTMIAVFDDTCGNWIQIYKPASRS